MLTDRAISALKPKDKEYRVSDAKGLFLMVTPTGMKVWRTIYTRGGKRHLVKLGEYPAMSLAEARLARQQLRLDIQHGADPQRQLQAARRQMRDRFTSNLFEQLARERHAYMAKTTWTPAYAKQVMQRLQNHAFKHIGDLPVRMITRGDIINVLERCVLRSGKFQANHLRQHLVGIFEDLADREIIEANVAMGLGRRFRIDEKTPQPAVLTIEEARDVLAKLEASRCSVTLKLMHRFMALTGLRPSEVREAQWSEIQGDVWRIPAARMKGRRGRKRTHTVFLSPQAQEVLAVARTLSRPDAVYVFPSDWFGGRRHQPYDRASLTRQLTLALGPRIHVAHGWRASFSTVLNEYFPADRNVIDAMLAHQNKGRVEGSYNRTTELNYRRRAGQLWCEWADLLLKGAPSAWALAGLPEAAGNVVPMIGRAA